MQKFFLLTATLSGSIGVILGAIGSHLLKNKINYWELNSYETGVRYQFIHVFALIAVAILLEKTDSKLMSYSGISFIIGMLLFSGSLYVLSLKSLLDINIAHILGPVTPIGGLFLIVGWILLFIAIYNDY